MAKEAGREGGGGRYARPGGCLGGVSTSSQASVESVARAGTAAKKPKPRHRNTSGSRRKLNNGVQAEDSSHHWVDTEISEDEPKDVVTAKKLAKQPSTGCEEKSSDI
jgi:hypothetical protein